MTNYLLVSLAVVLSTANAADFTTYFGGANNQYLGTALAADSVGDTYVTGGYAFVTKLDPAGNIVFTNPVGGQCCAVGDAIAVDPSGNIWIGGYTTSQSFPLVNPLQSAPPSPSNPGSGIGFLMKMAPDGTVLYSSYFGGVQGTTTVSGIATDQSGIVYLTGVTSSSDFPTTAGLPASPGSITGAFVTKLSSDGQKIIYSTVIAGTSTNCSGTGCTSVAPYTAGSGIAVDGSGSALVAGNTNTTDLPAPSGSTTGTGPFALKINAAGNELVYVTFIGPPPGAVNGVNTSTGIGGRPIAADASGNAYIAGNTNSPAFSTTSGAYQTTNAASPDSGEAFAVKLDPDGATIWATLLGSDLNGSGAYAIALDGSDNVWLTGGDGFVSGTAGSFVAELSANGSARSYLEQLPTGEAGLDIAIDTSGVVHVLGQGSLVSTITGTSSAPRVLSILNAAGGVGQLTTGLIAPGEIISIYGSGLSPASPIAATPQNGLFPTILGGVQVLVNGGAIPLLYVSGSQINAEIPSPLNGVENGIAVMQVVYSTTEWDPVQQITFMTALPEFRLSVVDSQFAAFRNQTGSLAIINQDGTVNKIANPAKVGSVVSIWASGFGSTGPAVNGSAPAAANNYCGSCQITLSVGETSVTETVQYAGTSPGLIDGLMQINFLIPMQLVFNGAWVYFTPPGATQPLMLGWVDTTQ